MLLNILTVHIKVALVVKNPPANVGDIRTEYSTLGSGRSPGEENGNPLQRSCLEKSMDRGAWGARVHGVTKNQTRQSTPTQQIKTRFFQFSSFYFCNTMLLSQDFPVAQMVKNLSAMQQTQVRSMGWEDPLEKEMAIHSSIPAWRIPWTEEPGGLQPMGLQRIGHD